jgi:hypothetical protein
MGRISAGLVVFCLTTSSLLATTFTVINTNDSGPGSLRQAILDANGSPGSTIAFNIPGSGVHTISSVSALPSLSVTTTLDGYTQPGASPNSNGPGLPDNAVLLIELDGTNAGSSTGLVVTGGSSTIRGLVVNRFGSYGIELQSAGNTIEGDFIGTDPSGTAARANGNGGGIAVTTGNANTIGGTTPDARNLVSGNIGVGVNLQTDGNTVSGNFIGTDVTGSVALGNSDRGVLVFGGSSDTVGGATPDARNVISGNGDRGVQFISGSDHLLQGNYIGTDVTDSFAIPNGDEGVELDGTAGVLVGGATLVPGTGPGNVISGNIGVGVSVFADPTGNQIEGNIIGADGTGTNPLGNSLDGVLLRGGPNAVGGTAPGAGNLIAFNGASGIQVFLNASNVQNVIRHNFIHDNQRLGIDLQAPGDGPNGVTSNDLGDGDVGANGLQNFPVISSITYGANTTVTGLLNSMANTTFDLDFYVNPACSNFPRDFLQGETYLGSSQVTTDGSGNAPFNVSTLPAVANGSKISVTATDPSGNTSEFSQRLPFSVDLRSGPPAGGTALNVSGTNFLAGATVTIGGVAATGVAVNSYTSMSATTPPLAAGTANDLVVTNTDATTGTLVKAFVADFLDVPSSQQFYSYVTTLVSNGITAGIGGGLYGVNDDTLRQQMAVFILKGEHGLCFVPPPCAGVFTDVPCPSTFADWIEEMAAEGITGGCGGGHFCPQSAVRRDQMSVFLLKGEHGSSYVPPPCSGVFMDVPCPSTFANWIEQLAAEGITGGCGGGDFCPSNPNTRGQMAVFMTKTFNLQ